ncbi:phytanoyl-CoA dioxygenase family protein [Lacunimicrobium album]
MDDRFMLLQASDFTKIQHRYENDGFCLLEDIYSSEQLSRLSERMTWMTAQATTSIRQRDGDVYAARNVLDLCPDVADLWKTPPLTSVVLDLLGPDACLVRGLFFDKPPTSSWGLPWHKDLLIAIQPPPVLSSSYSPPRDRLGVLHTEPPLEVLERMLTLRIHLDEVTHENGPLEVAAGSHHSGKLLQLDGRPSELITTPQGGVLVMHRLLAHASGRSEPGTTRHRRILHLEFASSPVLPDNYQWYQQFPVGSEKI